MLFLASSRQGKDHVIQYRRLILQPGHEAISSSRLRSVGSYVNTQCEEVEELGPIKWLLLSAESVEVDAVLKLFESSPS
jgi:hypothetical protein